MALEVKICGVTTPEAARAAAEGGAAMIGLMFFSPSPRSLTVPQAADLAAATPAAIARVGVFVDADDAEIEDVLTHVPLDMLQLHGGESPARVAEVDQRFGLPVIKALKVAGEADLAPANDYAAVADRLLFDAKPPIALRDALPGGNALRFDWELLRGRVWPIPWMLSGGLTAANLAEAVGISGARAVDVSSGVEDRRGHKDPGLIAAFLEAAAKL